MNIEKLKNSILDSIGEWIEERIDTLAMEHPQIATGTVYLKRGAHNYFFKERKRIDEMIRQIEMFIADENGDVNVETLFNDFISMFKEIEERPFNAGPLRGKLGKGAVCIDIPDNFVCTLLFGDCNTIRITTDDLMELKNMVVGCTQDQTI